MMPTTTTAPPTVIPEQDNASGLRCAVAATPHSKIPKRINAAPKILLRALVRCREILPLPRTGIGNDPFPTGFAFGLSAEPRYLGSTTSEKRVNPAEPIGRRKL
jgi:hypothetical protein